MKFALNEVLLEEIMADLTIELNGEPGFNQNVLRVKVKDAMKEVIMRRNYQATSYTDEKIKDDLYNFASVIKKVALFDYNQIGAEGQISHNENSVSRSWVDRDSLFNGVFAFVNTL